MQDIRITLLKIIKYNKKRIFCIFRRGKTRKSDRIFLKIIKFAWKNKSKKRMIMQKNDKKRKNVY